jgi:MFS family permease
VSETRINRVPMWVLGLVIMIDQVDQNIVRGVIPQLKESFGINDAQVGVLMSIFLVVNGLVTVPAGYLADRWNRTRAIGHTVVAWSAITAVTAAAQSFVQLLGLRAILGFGQAVTEPSAGSLLADYYPTNQRGRAFSLHQVLLFVGIGLGVGLGGAVGSTLGWRWAFVIVGAPGTLIAAAAYRLTEPGRGHGERVHLGLDASAADGADGTGAQGSVPHEPLFEHGFRSFVGDMTRGLAQDLRTILAIPSLRLALVGVGVLLFTVNAAAAWLPVFHERFSGLTQAESTSAFMVLVLFGGIPGILLGGRLADAYAGRIQGARVVIPAYCIWVGSALFAVSYLKQPFATSYVLELVGFFAITMSIPALRAGFTDVIPANLRGAGFGAFNLVSVVFGAAAAPVVLGGLAEVFDLRAAFLMTSPLPFVGAYVLYRARYHLDADAAKIFEAVVRAMQDAEALDETRRTSPAP